LNIQALDLRGEKREITYDVLTHQQLLGDDGRHAAQQVLASIDNDELKKERNRDENASQKFANMRWTRRLLKQRKAQNRRATHCAR
jgi:hypothetical protein